MTIHRLRAVDNSDQEWKFGDTSISMTIGRRDSSDVRLVDEEVSRRHCRLRISEDVVEIEDLNSLNGTYVNERKVSREVLRDGDRIIVGNTLLIFDVNAEPSDHRLDLQIS